MRQKTEHGVRARSTVVRVILLASGWAGGAHAAPEQTAPPAPAGLPVEPAAAPVPTSEVELPRESAVENPLGRAPAMSGSAFGGYGERITKPDDIVPAIKRGIEKTQAGIPVLLEFITSKETEVSRPGT